MSRPELKRPTKKTFLIVHDAGLMEEYLGWVRRVLEHSHANFMALGARSLEESLDGLKSQRILARKQDARIDEAWCIVDGTLHTTADLPALKATFPDVQVAVVAPSFEHWLLMHFQDVSPSMTQGEVRLHLGKAIPDFDGTLRNRENMLFGKFDVARDRAIDASPDLGIHSMVETMRTSLQLFRGHDVPPRL